jgi:hypothetical protein
MVRNRGRFISGHNESNRGQGDKRVSLDTNRKSRSTYESTLAYQQKYFPKTKRKQYQGPPSWLTQERQ